MPLSSFNEYRRLYVKAVVSLFIVIFSTSPIWHPDTVILALLGIVGGVHPVLTVASPTPLHAFAFTYPTQIIDGKEVATGYPYEYPDGSPDQNKYNTRLKEYVSKYPDKDNKAFPFEAL